jgi:hypothetical protein
MARTTRKAKKSKKAVRASARKAAGSAAKKAATRTAKASAKRVARGARKTKRAASPPLAFAGGAVRVGRRRLMTIAPGLESFVASSPALTQVTEDLSRNVTVTVAPKTMCEERLQDQRGKLGGREVDAFRPRPESMPSAAERLKQLGFVIRREGRFTITACGPAELVSDVLDVELALQARPQRVPFRATQNFAASYAPPRPDDLFVAPVQSLTVKTSVSPHIDDFIFVPPPHFFAPSAVPAPHDWPGLDASMIQSLLGVPNGSTGRNVKVAVIDTGFFPHPYYAANGFDYQPTPTTVGENAAEDPNGHGTAIASNVFAVAPRATVLGFRQTDPPQDALEIAADAGVDIISCSWGWAHEQSFPHLELTIRDIVRERKIVLFASGNGQHAWPGSMPEVISIGGVFADPQRVLEASNYASGFTSDLYPGRKVPDVCGLVGQKPSGIYIMMPCPPGSIMDGQLGGGAFPDRDETRVNDGWVGASGTSSATPQIAGVIALMVERARAAGRALDNESVRQLLQSTAVPVQKGHNAQGFPAVGHPNVAVGHGLVNAGAALAAI